MQRILVVLRGPIDAGTVRRRCTLEVTEPYEMAICRVLPTGFDGTHERLRAQQETTAALRRAMGSEAERIAILVATEQQGDCVDDCARDWGATLVYT